jgi:hypothetical protein
MLPRPTKPTVTCCSGTLIAIATAFLLLSSASIVIAGRPADQSARPPACRGPWQAGALGDRVQPRNDSICGTNAAWSWNRKARAGIGEESEPGARDQAGEFRYG